MNKILLILGVFALLLFFIRVHHLSARDLSTVKQRIAHFDEVDVNLYRGGQPRMEDLKLLKELGIKKIINLRYEKQLVEKERRAAEALGMEYINIPWTIFGPYHRRVFERFFEAIKDKDEKPVFFHCKRGSERTGVLAAAYKIKILGVSLADALADAQKYHIKFIWRPFVNAKIRRFEKEMKKK